jgi:hypothetical protein
VCALPSLYCQKSEEESKYSSSNCNILWTSVQIIQVTIFFAKSFCTQVNGSVYIYEKLYLLHRRRA